MQKRQSTSIVNHPQKNLMEKNKSTIYTKNTITKIIEEKKTLEKTFIEKKTDSIRKDSTIKQKNVIDSVALKNYTNLSEKTKQNCQKKNSINSIGYDKNYTQKDTSISSKRETEKSILNISDLGTQNNEKDLSFSSIQDKEFTLRNKSSFQTNLKKELISPIKNEKEIKSNINNCFTKNIQKLLNIENPKLNKSQLGRRNSQKIMSISGIKNNEIGTVNISEFGRRKSINIMSLYSEKLNVFTNLEVVDLSRRNSLKHVNNPECTHCEKLRKRKEELKCINKN